MREEEPVDILGYFWRLRKYYIWGIIVTVIVGLAAYLVLPSLINRNKNSIQVSSVISGVLSQNSPYENDSSWYYYSARMLSSASIAESPSFLADVAADSNLPESVSNLQSNIDVQYVTATNLIQITYTGSASRQDASTTVNAVAKAIINSEFFDSTDPYALTFSEVIAPTPGCGLCLESMAPAQTGVGKIQLLILCGGLGIVSGLITIFVINRVRRRSPVTEKG